jgi:hypothetical protein
MSAGNKFLPKEFEPGFNDVLIGRGKRFYKHSGNKIFRILVASRLGEYSVATSKMEKSKILVSAVSEIQKKSPHGGFIKKDPETGLWFQIGEFLAREKTSQAFRDALHDSYKSSNSSRKKRRKTKRTNTATPNQLVQPTFSYNQQCDTSLESSSSTTIIEPETSSIHSNFSDQRCRVEAFDNVSLDEICPSENIDIDIDIDIDHHDFDLEKGNDSSKIKLEDGENTDLTSICSSLIFDSGEEDDEFEVYSNDLKKNKLFQGKLCEDEMSAYSGMDLSYLYLNKPQYSFSNAKMYKCASDTQDRKTNSNRSMTSMPRRNTSVAMTA